MDERALTERLLTYDTSTLEGMQSAAGFVKGWLEARDVEVTGTEHNGRPVLAATVGPADGTPTIVVVARSPLARGNRAARSNRYRRLDRHTWPA
jgi:acetylornithine deacetylase/succinyl-diaminopimelate desuccinylase-like protein